MKDVSETQTCLYKEQTVRKDHPRIAFRGGLDTLLAQTVCCQLAIRRAGHSDVEKQLDVMAAVIRALLCAEYSGQSFDIESFDAVDWEGMHSASHHPMAHFGIPHPIMDAVLGEGVAVLNLLRTRIRDCERLAVTAFDAGREDMVHALNRMSSFVYVLMCALCAKEERASCK